MTDTDNELGPGHRKCPHERAQAKLDRLAEKGKITNSGVDPSRYHALHADGRELIEGWLRRAQSSSADFEAFIYAWISFNGWATCCCAEDGDRPQLDMMMLDGGLNDNFSELHRSEPFRNDVERFSSLWPIFRVIDLPQSVRVSRPQHRGRQAVVDHYQSNCPNARREPDCHLTHPNAASITRDWPHTLEALYRVRCNLFHGQKSGGGNEDREIVQAALRVLLPIAGSALRMGTR